MYLAFFRNTIERDRWINEVSVIGLTDVSFFVQTDLSIDTISLCYSDGTIELVSFTETTVTIGDKDYRKITLDSPFKCGRYCLMLTYGENFQWSEWFDAENYSFSADDIIFDKWHLPIMSTSENLAVDLTKRNHPIFDKNFLPQWQWYAEVYAPYDIIISGQIFLVDSLGNETFLTVSGGNNYQQTLNDLSTKVISSYLGEDYTTAEGWYKYKAFVLIGVDGNPLATAFIYGYSDWFYLADPVCDYEKNLVKITLQNDTNLGSIPYWYGSEFTFKIPAYLREIEVPKTEDGESDINQFLVPTLQYHKNRYILQTGLIDSTTVDVLRTLPFWDSVIIESVTKTIFDLKNVEVSVEWQFDQKEFAVAEINMQAELIYKDILPEEYLVEFYVSNESGVISGASIEINGETLTTNASGYASINLLNGTYDYIVSKSGNYTVTGTVTVNGGATVYVTMIAGGLYTEAELDDMINNQGYIPVATGAEYNSIRTPGNKTMGAGTKWEGTYNVQLTSSYVQILPISLAAYQSGGGFTSINLFNGIYDGNLLKKTDLYQNTSDASKVGLFIFATVAPAYIVRNVIVFEPNVTQNLQGVGIICGSNRNGGTIEKTAIVGGSMGQASNLARIGAICGTNSGIISECWSSADVSTTATTGEGAGGLVGYNAANGQINNCYCKGDVDGGTYCGGLVGYQISGSITNCYSTGAVTGHSNVKGLLGLNSGGTITNSYWDVETSGQATSAGGTGQFTAIMKQSPVPGSGVYDLWSSAIWDAMSVTEYTQLKNNYE